jgi:hypothetical protein
MIIHLFLGFALPPNELSEVDYPQRGVSGFVKISVGFAFNVLACGSLRKGEG